MRPDAVILLALLASASRACVLGPPPPVHVIDCLNDPEAELRYPAECTDASSPADDAGVDDGGTDAGP